MSGHAYAALISHNIDHAIFSQGDSLSLAYLIPLIQIAHRSFHRDLSNCFCLALVLSHTASFTHLLLSHAAFLSHLSHSQTHTATPLDLSSRFAFSKSVFPFTFRLLHLSCGRSNAPPLALALSLGMPTSISLTFACYLYNCVSNSASSYIACLSNCISHTASTCPVPRRLFSSSSKCASLEATLTVLHLCSFQHVAHALCSHCHSHSGRSLYRPRKRACYQGQQTHFTRPTTLLR